MLALTRATIGAPGICGASRWRVNAKVAGAAHGTNRGAAGRNEPFGNRWSQWYPETMARVATKTKPGARNWDATRM